MVGCDDTHLLFGVLALIGCFYGNCYLCSRILAADTMIPALGGLCRFSMRSCLTVTNDEEYGNMGSMVSALEGFCLAMDRRMT